MSEEELKLLNEMKENCINQANYVDPNAMKKYNLLRRLEDVNDDLQQENQQLKEGLNQQYGQIRNLDLSRAIKEKDLCFYEQQNNLYKNVIDEVRECCDLCLRMSNDYIERQFANNVLEILSKSNIKEKKNEKINVL